VVELAAVEPQNLLHRLDQLAPARMKQKTVEVRQAVSMPVEKTVERRRQRGTHQLRQLRTENHAEAVVFDIPSHDVFGIWPAPLADGHDARSAAATAAPAVLRNSTAAAPSPNKAPETNIAGLGSLTRKHRLHRSTVRNSTCAFSVA
jgi:hypothetical protein